MPPALHLGDVSLARVEASLLSMSFGEVVDVGVDLTACTIPSAQADKGMGTYSWFLTLMQACWVAKTGVSAREFFGYPGSKKTESVTFKGFAPVNSVYDGLEDYSRYSFPLGEAVRQLSHSRGLDGSHHDEHPVHHFTVHGTVRPKGTGLYTFVDATLCGAPFPSAQQRHIYGYLAHFGLGNNVYPTSFGTTMTHQANVVTPLRSLEQLASWARSAQSYSKANNTRVGNTGPNGPIAAGYWWHPNIYSGISDFTYKNGVFEFVEWYSNTLYGTLSRADIRIEVSVVRNGFDPVYSKIGSKMFDYILSFRRQTRWYQYDPLASSDVPLYRRSPTNDTLVDFAQRFVNPICFPLTKPFSIGPEIGTAILGTGNYKDPFTGKVTTGSMTLSGFYAEALKAQRWLRPSVNEVLSDLADELRNVASNWIETVKEADELLELFPSEQLREFLFAVDHQTSKLHGNIPARLRAIARACAGGYLLYSFGWMPLVGTPQDASRTLEVLASKLETLERVSTLRAGKSFDVRSAVLPEGLSPTRFTVRTKVRIGGFSNQFSSDVLQLDSVGFLPTSARLWDLAPGSWLADYFLNLSDRFASLDSWLLFSLMDARTFVHSYTLEYDISDSFLNAFGLESAGVPVRFRLYVREVSAYVPFLFDASTASLFIKEGRPKWGIILALVASLVL